MDKKISCFDLRSQPKKFLEGDWKNCEYLVTLLIHAVFIAANPGLDPLERLLTNAQMIYNIRKTTNI